MAFESWGPALEAAQGQHGKLPARDLAALCVAVSMHGSRPAGGPGTAGQRWALLEAALMSPYPAHFFEALRACKGLKLVLPELDALFGVPQLSDAPEPVDVGQHQLTLVNLAARAGAPLAIRFAALMHKIGMGGTPREIWPSHYKHEARAHALLGTLAQRVAVPGDALALAHLVVDECDRVHRVSDMRAGPIAAMLARLQALEQPERFELLLRVCTLDHAAYAGHSEADYVKAPRLRRALAAYAGADVGGLAPDAAMDARALAIAQALRGGACLS